jgi:hypothetical protein
MNTVDVNTIFTQYPGMALGLLITVAALVALKGFALWRAARNNSSGWFVTLLLINTLGILEILYLFVWGRPKK